VDIASLLGVILGIGMVLFGIIQNGGVPALLNFLDAPSAIITIGGSLSAVLCSNKLSGFIAGIKSFALPFKEKSVDPGETINKIIELSNVSRKEGLLALEEAAGSIDDEFLKKGIMLVVDGTDAELVRGILETDMLSMEERHKKTISFWEFWGEQGPAWGMIGTLVGLINMLQKMDDPSTIGPQMAVALVTTFYGSMIANWLCTPTATKLAQMNATEIRLKEVTVEGLLSIQAGENPRVIEEKLKSFLSPGVRESFSTDGREAGGEE
jgi:chemotaxis protein MotA